MIDGGKDTYKIDIYQAGIFVIFLILHSCRKPSSFSCNLSSVVYFYLFHSSNNLHLYSNLTFLGKSHLSYT